MITLTNTQEFLNTRESLKTQLPKNWDRIFKKDEPLYNLIFNSTQRDVQPMTSDIINHPPHYIEGRSYEPIDVIEDWKLPYHLGNVIKYISRAGRKGKGNEYVDLMKASWYLNRYIEQIKGTNSGTLD